jgi:hypothetical protein
MIRTFWGGFGDQIRTVTYYLLLITYCLLKLMNLLLPTTV